MRIMWSMHARHLYGIVAHLSLVIPLYMQMSSSHIQYLTLIQSLLATDHDPTVHVWSAYITKLNVLEPSFT